MYAKPLCFVSYFSFLSFVIFQDGVLWSFGDDSHIQLGLGDTRSAGNDTRATSGSQGYLRHISGKGAMGSDAAGRTRNRQVIKKIQNSNKT